MTDKHFALDKKNFQKEKLNENKDLMEFLRRVEKLFEKEGVNPPKVRYSSGLSFGKVLQKSSDKSRENPRG